MDSPLQLEDDQAVDFAPKVVKTLNSTLQGDAKLSPADAALALNALYPDHRQDGDDAGERESGEGFLWWFWDLFHDLARQVPHDSPASERLAAVVKALRDLPPKTVDLQSWGEAQLWSDLPLFGPTLREKWDSEPRVPAGADEKRRMLNLQTYAARVAGLGLAPLEMYAIWAFTDALEGEMTPIRGAPDEVNSDPTAVEDLPFKVAVAAAWAIHAGYILHGRDEEIRGTLGGPLWKLDKKEGLRLKRKYRGTQGLCPERWALWKLRFGVIRDNGNIDEETRRRAGEAVDAMERVERGE